MIENLFDIRIFFTLCILLLFYKWGRYRQDLHLKLGRKGPRPLPFFGNILTMLMMGMHKFDIMCREKYGKIYPIYLGGKPLCVVSDDEVLKQILIKDFKCFTDRMNLGFRSKTTKNMLTQLKGKDWERVRNFITPNFTSGKLKKMSPLLSDCVDLLTDRLRSIPQDGNVNIKEFFGALTMDAIARTMFGMKIDSQTNPQNLFIINAQKLFNFSLFRPLTMLILLFPSIGKLILKFKPNWELIGSGTLEFFSKNIEKAINERKISKEYFNDFLALVLKYEKEDKNKENTDLQNDKLKYLTLDEIQAQSFIFLIAGYETTATTLMYVSYFLAKNRDIQEQLYNELQDEIGDEKGEISYDIVMKLPLLDGAINETLRICPPAVRFDRVFTQDIDLITSDNRIIHAKKDDTFMVPVYAIHSDPSIWPNPKIFDIHRFDQERKTDRSPYAFMPFGMGPRNCVGMRFALLEMKWALCSILKDFEFLPCEQTPDTIKFKTMGLSQPEKPIILKIRQRHQ